MSALLAFSLFLLTGCLTGILAGLLGVGGGLLIVPVLLFLFPLIDIHPDLLMHMAVATSLTSIVATAISATFAHHKKRAVLWPLFWSLLPGILLGTLFGSLLATWLDSQHLKYFFALFLLLVSLQMAGILKFSGSYPLPRLPGMILAGSSIGLVSTLIGIGGGSMTVPFLQCCRIKMVQAIATSSACGLPIALAATLAYIYHGWHISSLPAWSTGYVYWPAAIGIISTSILFAPVGAMLAHRLPVLQLKRFFALFLLLISIHLFMS